jgi:site-specific DNA-methyltransferase (adenine-specific)
MVYKAQTPEAQQWAGWKTALKPAHEPICMARKPFKGSTIDNVLTHGVGALNIDATRIDDGGELKPGNLPASDPRNDWHYNGVENNNTTSDEKWIPNEQGRFPSNVLGEVEGYQKYFYCPKVSRRERHCGFEQKDIPTGNNFGDALKGDGKMWGKHQSLQKNNYTQDGTLGRMKDAMHNSPNAGNNHPTVKPVALMRYLIKLVTPPNSTVLDPFCGSGSTGMAAVELGHRFIGCELDPNYVAIAERRITAWNTSKPSGTTYETLFEEKD